MTQYPGTPCCTWRGSWCMGEEWLMISTGSVWRPWWGGSTVQRYSERAFRSLLIKWVHCSCSDFGINVSNRSKILKYLNLLQLGLLVFFFNNFNVSVQYQKRLQIGAVVCWDGCFCVCLWKGQVQLFGRKKNFNDLFDNLKYFSYIV